MKKDMLRSFRKKWSACRRDPYSLLLFILVGTGLQGWVIGLMVFVLSINLAGMLPLVQELKKQRSRLKEILAEEE